MQRKLCCLLYVMFCAALLHGNELALHDLPPSTKFSTSQKIVGVALVPDQCSLLNVKELKTVRGVEIFNIPALENCQSIITKIAKMAIDQPFTFAMAEKVKHVISEYLYSIHDPFAFIYIPAQMKNTGVLQIVVLSAKVGTVQVEGNKYCSEESIREKLPLKTGEPIQLRQLDRSLYLLNRNPFRRVDLIYSPGERTGMTDVKVVVQDRRPYRFLAGFNNSGVATTDRQRWITGVTLSDPFGLDTVFSVQYMAAYKVRHFQSVTAQYLIPFSWGHQLTTYGGYSSFNTKKGFPATKSQGESYQASLRYNVPIYVLNGIVRQLIFGFDFKGTNSTVEFSQLFENTASTVNLTQLTLAYNQVSERASHRVDFDVEINWSPGKWLPNQTNADYASLRPGGKNQWILGRASLKYLQKLPMNFEIVLLGRGQIASQNLLPSEQIGLGGASTVRGYTERQLNYDGGFLATFEAHSPKFPLISAIRKRAVNDSIYFLGFIDYGWGSNHKTLPGEPNDNWLMGIGPGIRYSLPPYVNATFDWGFKLHQKAVYIGGGSMLYFNVIFTY